MVDKYILDLPVDVYSQFYSAYAKPAPPPNAILASTLLIFDQKPTDKLFTLHAMFHNKDHCLLNNASKEECLRYLNNEERAMPGKGKVVIGAFTCDNGLPSAYRFLGFCSLVRRQDRSSLLEVFASHAGCEVAAIKGETYPSDPKTRVQARLIKCAEQKCRTWGITHLWLLGSRASEKREFWLKAGFRDCECSEEENCKSFLPNHKVLMCKKIVTPQQGIAQSAPTRLEDVIPSEAQPDRRHYSSSQPASRLEHPLPTKPQPNGHRNSSSQPAPRIEHALPSKPQPNGHVFPASQPAPQLPRAKTRNGSEPSSWANQRFVLVDDDERETVAASQPTTKRAASPERTSDVEHPRAKRVRYRAVCADADKVSVAVSHMIVETTRCMGVLQQVAGSDAQRGYADRSDVEAQIARVEKAAKSWDAVSSLAAGCFRGAVCGLKKSLEVSGLE